MKNYALSFLMSWYATATQDCKRVWIYLYTFKTAYYENVIFPINIISIASAIELWLVSFETISAKEIISEILTEPI